jgi:hypothetical protein
VDEHDAGLLGRCHCDYLIRRLILVDKWEGRNNYIQSSRSRTRLYKAIGTGYEEYEEMPVFRKTVKGLYRPQITSILPIVNRYMSQKGQACGLYVNGQCPRLDSASGWNKSSLAVTVRCPLLVSIIVKVHDP